MDRGRTVEHERDDDRDAGDPSPRDGRDTRGRLAGLRHRVPGLRGLRSRRAVRSLLVATAVAVVGVVGGGFLPVLGSFGQFVGLFVAAFCYGLVAARSHYVAVGVGGALAAVLGLVANAVLGSTLVPVVAGYGPEVAGVGATASLLVAVTGHYFGRDLRAGLTRDI